MIIKSLVQSGNSKAIVLDKAVMQAAGLSADTLFSVSINPNGGVTIQSIETNHAEIKHAAFKKVMKENKELLARLADK